jgi:5-carboxymethyl-2-hydroxymuconate isomerase
VPHITIEYSANIAEHHDIDALVAAVHAAALANGLAALDALRTRAEARTQYRIADGDADHAFIAIAVAIGPGRDSAAKHRFLVDVLDAAETQLGRAEASPLAVAWSIELREIDPEFRINRNHVRTRLQEKASR